MPECKDNTCVYCQWYRKANNMMVQVYWNERRWPDGLAHLDVVDIDASMELLATTEERSAHWN